MCKGYLGRDAIIDRIIFSRSEASERSITLWHTDQQSERWLSFKFMLYLTDAGEDMGAFSYVRGSHSRMLFRSGFAPAYIRHRPKIVPLISRRDLRRRVGRDDVHRWGHTAVWQSRFATCRTRSKRCTKHMQCGAGVGQCGVGVTIPVDFEGLLESLAGASVA